MKKTIRTNFLFHAITPMLFSTLAIGQVLAQKSEIAAGRACLKEEGNDLEFVKQFNKAMNLRFSNQNKKMLDMISSSFKDPKFKSWLDSQPDGVQKQLASAMSGALDGKSLEVDNLIADLRDFVDPTGVKWKLSNGGAVTYFKTTGERGQIVKVDIHRRSSAAGQMVDIDSYAYEASEVPDAKLLKRCLEVNKGYSNSRWILEEYTTNEKKKKFRLFLRGSAPAAADPKMVRSLMENVALSADTIEQEFFKEDAL